MKLHSSQRPYLLLLSVLLLASCSPVQLFEPIEIPKEFKQQKLNPEGWQKYAPAPVRTLYVTERQNQHWPWPASTEDKSKMQFNWHLSEDHTQLNAARSLVLKKIKHGYKPVRVAVIDIGYPEGAETKPALFKAGPDFYEKDQDITIEKKSHGLGVLNILAGGKIKVIDKDTVVYNGYMGGAPMVEVIMVRACPETVFFRQSPFVKHRLRHILEWAAHNEVDVISMSMGGIYSRSLGKAVQEARKQGVAMFFAAGNYATLPILSLIARTPDTIAFPAALNGAFAVCGATANDRTYTYPPGNFTYFKHGIKGWHMRGNRGPNWQMKKNVITTYTPNIPWIQPDPKHDPHYDLVELDGTGTSATTPQAAAAAALWLQYHRSKFTPEEWRSHHKVDAVYRALADSAKTLPAAPKSEEYTKTFFGHGILQAKKALEITPQEAMKRNAESPIHPGKNTAFARLHAITRLFAFFPTDRWFHPEKCLTPYSK